MIHGHKPSAYFQKGAAGGLIVEGECRQCGHCGYTWEYTPGSGTRRGFCMSCHSLICGRPECAAEQATFKARFPQRSFNCLPLTEWNERVRDEYDKDSRYKVLPSGIVVA